MIYALMASFFWGIMYYSNSKIVKTGMTYSQILFFSLPLWFFLLFLVRNADVVIISVLEMTYPIFILLIKFLFERERIEWSQVVGILVTIFGVFMVVKKD